VPASAYPSLVRILSLNAWGGALWDELGPWAAGRAGDVVCLQEVTRTPGLTGWTSFDDGERSLPQRANLFDDLRERMPRHQALFLASDSGPVRDTAGRRHRQDFGLGTFIPEAVPVVGMHADFVHAEFLDHADWPTGDRPRTAQAVRLIDRDAKRAVTVVHLHGLRDPEGKGDTPARREQADRLAALVTQVRRTGDLCVVCGDLNLLPGSETFELLGSIGLVDLVGTADTRTSHYPKAVRHASYMLVSDPDAVRDFAVLDRPEVSDHRALSLEI
jgi:endonuclease/exonuclease/phosphatase family metal-dependent hydrolase